jgi:hypothetical protein
MRCINTETQDATMDAVIAADSNNIVLVLILIAVALTFPGLHDPSTEHTTSIA